VLAEKYSMDGNSKNGGDLGSVESGMMMNEFEK
jgi:parvulin-like peptidyl-prolyl isomerase